MKKTIAFILLATAMNSHAAGKMRTLKTIDNGESVTVMDPHIHGCANEGCQGGAGQYYLKPSFSGRKICAELGFGFFIKGSKVLKQRKVSMVYNVLGYYVLEPYGPAGMPQPKLRTVINSVDCEKP